MMTDALSLSLVNSTKRESLPQAAKAERLVTAREHMAQLDPLRKSQAVSNLLKVRLIQSLIRLTVKYGTNFHQVCWFGNT